MVMLYDFLRDKSRFQTPTPPPSPPRTQMGPADSIHSEPHKSPTKFTKKLGTPGGSKLLTLSNYVILETYPLPFSGVPFPLWGTIFTGGSIANLFSWDSVDGHTAPLHVVSSLGLPCVAPLFVLQTTHVDIHA